MSQKYRIDFSPAGFAAFIVQKQLDRSYLTPVAEKSDLGYKEGVID
jgi:hypothetical protein